MKKEKPQIAIPDALVLNKILIIRDKKVMKELSDDGIVSSSLSRTILHTNVTFA